MPLFRVYEGDFQHRDRLLVLTSNVWALMVWPNDSQARKSYVASCVVEEHRIYARAFGASYQFTVTYNDPELSIFDPNKAVDQATPFVVKGSSKSPGAKKLVGADVAGNILLQAFALQDGGGKDVGLSECITQQSQLLIPRNNKIRSMGARPKDLKEQWHEYHTIAHLNAAYIMYNKIQQYADGWISDPQHVFNFLQISNSYLERGEAIKHRNAKHPILHPGEGWRFDFQPVGTHEPGSEI